MSYEMISLKGNNKKGVEGILDTPEKVRNLRRELDEATEEDFKRYAKAKRNARHLAKYHILD